MKTLVLIVFGLIFVRVPNAYADGNIADFDEYFDIQTGTHIHIPIQGSKRLPEDVSSRLGDLLGLGYLDYGAVLFAAGKVLIGENITGYVILDDSYSPRSVIFVADSKSGEVYSREELSEESYDAGYGGETVSWLVDVDNDGYIDVIKGSIEVELDFEKSEESDVDEFICTKAFVSLFLYSADSHSFNEANGKLGLLNDSRFDEFFDEIEEGCPRISRPNRGD